MSSPVSSSDAPKAIGPYSQAQISGNHVFTSGQIAIDLNSGKIEENSIEKQTEIVINNLKAVLEAAGSSLSKTVKTTVYLKNINDFSKVNEIYAKHFSSKPARSTIEVSNLPKGALIEIDCIAEI